MLRASKHSSNATHASSGCFQNPHGGCSGKASLPSTLTSLLIPDQRALTLVAVTKHAMTSACLQKSCYLKGRGFVSMELGGGVVPQVPRGERNLSGATTA